MRDAHAQRAAGREDAVRFAHRAGIVLDVHHHHRRDDQIEGAVRRSRRARSRSDSDTRCRGRRRPRARVRPRRGGAAVDAGDARAARGQRARVRAFAASEIEHAPPGDVAGERQHARLQEQVLIVARIGVLDPGVGGRFPGAGRWKSSVHHRPSVARSHAAGLHGDDEVARRVEIAVADVRLSGCFASVSPGRSSISNRYVPSGTWIV